MSTSIRIPTNGRQLCAARSLLGWSQTQLAEAARLHPKSVAYWEQHGTKRIGGFAVTEMARAFSEQGLIFVDGGMLRIAGDIGSSPHR